MAYTKKDKYPSLKTPGIYPDGDENQLGLNTGDLDENALGNWNSINGDDKIYKSAFGDFFKFIEPGRPVKIIFQPAKVYTKIFQYKPDGTKRYYKMDVDGNRFADSQEYEWPWGGNSKGLNSILNDNQHGSTHTPIQWIASDITSNAGTYNYNSFGINQLDLTDLTESQANLYYAYELTYYHHLEATPTLYYLSHRKYPQSLYDALFDADLGSIMPDGEGGSNGSGSVDYNVWPNEIPNLRNDLVLGKSQHYLWSNGYLDHLGWSSTNSIVATYYEGSGILGYKQAIYEDGNFGTEEHYGYIMENDGTGGTFKVQLDESLKERMDNIYNFRHQVELDNTTYTEITNWSPPSSHTYEAVGITGMIWYKEDWSDYISYNDAGGADFTTDDFTTDDTVSNARYPAGIPHYSDQNLNVEYRLILNRYEGNHATNQPNHKFQAWTYSPNRKLGIGQDAYPPDQNTQTWMFRYGRRPNSIAGIRMSLYDGKNEVESKNKYGENEIIAKIHNYSPSTGVLTLYREPIKQGGLRYISSAFRGNPEIHGSITDPNWAYFENFRDNTLQDGQEDSLSMDLTGIDYKYSFPNFKPRTVFDKSILADVSQNIGVDFEVSCLTDEDNEFINIDASVSGSIFWEAYFDTSYPVSANLNIDIFGTAYNNFANLYQIPHGQNKATPVNQMYSAPTVSVTEGEINAELNSYFKKYNNVYRNIFYYNVIQWGDEDKLLTNDQILSSPYFHVYETDVVDLTDKSFNSKKSAQSQLSSKPIKLNLNKPVKSRHQYNLSPGIKSIKIIIYRFTQDLSWLMETTLVTKNILINDGLLLSQDFDIFGGTDFNFLPLKDNQAIIGGLDENSDYNISVEKIIQNDDFVQEDFLERLSSNEFFTAFNKKLYGESPGQIDLGINRMFKASHDIYDFLNLKDGVMNQIIGSGFPSFADDFYIKKDDGNDISIETSKLKINSDATDIFINDSENLSLKEDCIIELVPQELEYISIPNETGTNAKAVLIGDYKINQPKNAAMQREGVMRTSVLEENRDKQAF